MSITNKRIDSSWQKERESEHAVRRQSCSLVGWHWKLSKHGEAVGRVGRFHKEIDYGGPSASNGSL
jgi:hypothetical protein